MSQLRKDISDLKENGEVGDWAFTEGDAAIVIRMPIEGYSHGIICEWRLSPVPLPDQDDWQWDGNREAPTLTPSLNWVGVWHGYMREGKLVPA